MSNCPLSPILLISVATTFYVWCLSLWSIWKQSETFSVLVAKQVKFFISSLVTLVILFFQSVILCCIQDHLYTSMSKCNNISHTPLIHPKMLFSFLTILQWSLHLSWIDEDSLISICGLHQLEAKILLHVSEPMISQHAVLNPILFVFLRSNHLCCPKWYTGPLLYWFYLPIFCFQEISLPHFLFLCHAH